MKVSVIETTTGRCVSSASHTFLHMGPISSEEVIKEIKTGALKDAVDDGLIAADEIDRYEVKIED